MTRAAALWAVFLFVGGGDDDLRAWNDGRWSSASSQSGPATTTIADAVAVNVPSQGADFTAIVRKVSIDLVSGERPWHVRD